MLTLAPLSPGVYSTEIELSTVIKSVATSIGAVVGPSNKGPLDPTQVTTTKEFTEYYGTPITTNYFHYTALAFLGQGNRIICKRVINNALYGGVEVVNVMAEDPDKTAGIDMPGGCPHHPKDNYVWDSNYAVIALFGPDPGAYNNDLGITIKHNPTKLIGTATFTNGSRIVTGNSTKFTSEVAVGDLVYPEGQIKYSAKVESVDSDTQLTLESDWEGPDSMDLSIYINTLEFYITLYRREGTTIYEVNKFLCSRVQDAKDGFGRSIYIEDVFENSRYLLAIDNKDKPADAKNMPQEVDDIVWFTSGSNGDDVTPGQIMSALDELSNPDKYNIDVIMSGGYLSNGSGMFSEEEIEALHVYTDSIAQKRKSFAILDSPFGKTASELAEWRRNNLAINSSYSAVYAPWLRAYDRFNDKWLYLPPSGYIGAVFAYTDYVSDPWYAPAGLVRAVLPVSDVEQTFEQPDRNILCEAQINPIRKHPSGGIVVWAQRTLLTRQCATSSINIRRLLMTIEKAISATLDWFVFELNTHHKRMEVASLIEGYMNMLTAGSAFYDFRVVCDETNNTPEVIDRNEMIVDLYVKPVHAAEYIKLNVVIVRTGVSFDEVLLPQAT